MSERLGDASGRVYTDYTTPSLRNEAAARRLGVDPLDANAYRQALLGRAAPGVLTEGKVKAKGKGKGGFLSNLFG